MKNINKILLGDSIKKLKTIEENVVDLVILDPPYHKVVDEYGDKEHSTLKEYLNGSEEYIKEIARVSKKSATVGFYGFSKQLSHLIPIMEKYGFSFKQFIVLDKGIKSIAGRSSNKLKQYPTATEYIGMFYYDSRREIMQELQKHKDESKLSSKEINEYLGKASNGGGTGSSIAGKKQTNLQLPTKVDGQKLRKLFKNFDGKYEDYVYKFNLQTGLTDVGSDINFYIKDRVHPTQKPDQLTDRLIITSSYEGDLVLDPFAGSGSTVMSAIKNNRKYIAIERDEDFFKLIKKRIKELKNARG